MTRHKFIALLIPALLLAQAPKPPTNLQASVSDKPMAIVRVQAPAGVISSSANTDATVTFGSATAANNAIFVMVYTNSGGTPTISDSASGSYALDASRVLTEGVFIFSRLNAAAGVTWVKASISANWKIVFAAEYSGIATSAAFDKTAGATVVDNVNYSSGNTATTTQAAELLLGIVGTGYSSSASFVAGSGWTYPVAHAPIVADGDDAVWQERIVSATSAYAATGTSLSLTRVHVLIATYKAAAAGGLSIPVRRPYTQAVNRAAVY